MNCGWKPKPRLDCVDFGSGLIELPAVFVYQNQNLIAHPIFGHPDAPSFVQDFAVHFPHLSPLNLNPAVSVVEASNAMGKHSCSQSGRAV